MRKITFLFLFSLIGMMFACDQAPPPPASTIAATKIEQPMPPMKDGVVIHIKHGANDPQQALMGLLLADSFTPDHDVLVYLDVLGVDIGVKGMPDIMFKGHSVNEALNTLLKKNIEVMTCPGCMEAAGHKPEMLKEGITLRNNADFFTFTKGRILTFDY